MQIINQTFYTLKECFQIILESISATDKTHAYDIEGVAAWFSGDGYLKAATGDTISPSSYMLVNSSKVDKLFKSFYNRYMNQYFFCLEDKQEEEFDTEDMKKLAERMLELASIFNLKVEKYAELYQLYSTNYSSLLNKVDTMSVNANAFTDAPQDVATEVIETSPAYVSTFGKSQNSVSSDYEPLMNRLKTIQDNLRSIELDFLDEVGSIFYEHLNI